MASSPTTQMRLSWEYCSVVLNHGFSWWWILSGSSFQASGSLLCLMFCLCAKWKSLKCVTLCNPMDYTVHEILQARILEWVAVPFSRGFSQPRNQTGVSCIAGRFFTNWAIRETWLPKGNGKIVKVIQLCPTLCDLMDYTVDSIVPTGLYSPWNSPGQNIGVGSRSLLQGIFPTQGLNPSLPHCRQILYQRSHKGRINRKQKTVAEFPTDLKFCVGLEE